MVVSESVRVFLVDDHPIVRMGFRRLLEQYDHLSVAGEADSGEQALEKLTCTSADLALIDISMPGISGIALTGRLKKNYPDLRVIIVSMHDDRHYVEEALAAGADGYILKDNVNDLLPKAVREIRAGRRYLCPEAKNLLK